AAVDHEHPGALPGAQRDEASTVEGTTNKTDSGKSSHRRQLTAASVSRATRGRNERHSEAPIATKRTTVGWQSLIGVAYHAQQLLAVRLEFECSAEQTQATAIRHALMLSEWVGR